MPVRRGEVYFVDLDPTVGREMGGGKRRPVVVLSINDINRKPLVVTVVPGSTTASTFRNVVKVAPVPANGLSKHTYFQCHQIRAIDQSRFSPSPVGYLSSAEMARIEDAVRFCLGL